MNIDKLSTYTIAFLLFILALLFLIVGAKRPFLKECAGDYPADQKPCFYRKSGNFSTKEQEKINYDFLTIFLPFDKYSYPKNGPAKIIMTYPILFGIIKIPISVQGGHNSKSKYSFVTCKTENSLLRENKACQNNNLQSTTFPLISRGQLIGVQIVPFASQSTADVDRCQIDVKNIYNQIANKDGFISVLTNLFKSECALSSLVLYY